MSKDKSDVYETLYKRLKVVDLDPYTVGDRISEDRTSYIEM